MAERAVLKATIGIVRRALGPVLDSIEIEHVAIGEFFAGVKLSSGHAGACSSHGLDWDAEAVDQLSSRLPGRRAEHLLDAAADTGGLERVLGVATLNALAQLAAESRVPAGCEEVEGLDAFAAAEVQPNETVVVIGAFGPFLRRLRGIGARHVVLEMDPTLLTSHELPNYRPAHLAPDVVPHADVLFITGATLANDTFGGLIALARPDARIILVGPTVPIIPDAFFDCGVGIVAGVRVTDPDAFMSVIAQGVPGYMFFGTSAAKVVLRRRSCAAARLQRRRTLPQPVV